MEQIDKKKAVQEISGSPFFCLFISKSDDEFKYLTSQTKNRFFGEPFFAATLSNLHLAYVDFESVSIGFNWFKILGQDFKIVIFMLSISLKADNRLKVIRESNF